MSVILPGSTLGVLGGGQLGRMFVHAAQRMGYATAVLEADPHSPAGAASNHHIQASTEDEAALAQLVARCAAITTEFENVSAAAMQTLAAQRTVSPSAQCVAIAQNRIAEKSRLAQIAQQSSNPHAGPVPFIAIEKMVDITAAPDDCFPGLLKTATLGYDGKGQVKVSTRSQASIAFKKLGSVPCVLEQLAPLAAECSVVIARGADGQAVTLPVARNVHVDGILASSEIFEGNLPIAVMESARNATETIANELGYVGVLCVEFFILKDAQGGLSAASELRVNEIAPRPHNSGHWSLDASSVSQFELQVRTLCGLPLAPPVQRCPAVMLNLLGDAWFAEAGQSREPDWASVLAMPGVHLHLYGKSEARKARKMGHITVTADSPQAVCDMAQELAGMLGLPYTPSLA